MTRAAHPIHAVRLAQRLRHAGLTYEQIRRRIAEDLGLHVGYSTVRDWTTYYTRGAAL